MSDRIRFHFDPLCPWAWQGSRWIREVAKVRDIEVEWRLFSLQLINADRDDPLADEHVKGTPALRTLALIRRAGGNDAVGRVYETLGEMVHDNGESLTSETVQRAVAASGFDASLVDDALADESTSEEVRSEFEAAVSDVGCFGVPTIVLPSGRGMFGPVVAVAPTGEAAGEMWDRVRWMIDYDGFFELKRERDRKPGG
jgi:predicted DsbA family dithiol-disulfide isomerase